MATNDNFMDSVMNAINGVTTANTTTDTTNEGGTALTKGLGFHRFNGEPVEEVIHQIGADFSVEKQPILRIPQDLLERAMKGFPIYFSPDMLIGTHCATVNTRDNTTLGVVGSDYGVIQNIKGLEILDLLCNAEISGNKFHIVSGGIVHDSDPYIQVRLPYEIRTIGDNSPTELYASFHTRHDGKGGLRVSISAIRIVCQNTFNMNFGKAAQAKMNYRHTKNVASLLDWEEGGNIQRVAKLVESFKGFTKEHSERLNKLATSKINSQVINGLVAELFINEEETRRVAKEYGYNFDRVDTLSTRAKNQISAFKDTLESGIGQDTNRGSRLWVYNGVTNYFSNTYNYTSAEKRFDSLSQGTANEKTQLALDYLLAEV